MRSLILKKKLKIMRRVGKSDYYQLNLKNEFVKDLIRLDWALVKSSILGMPEIKAK